MHNEQGRAVYITNFGEPLCQQELNGLKNVRTREQLTLLKVVVCLRLAHRLSHPNARLPHRLCRAHRSLELQTQVIV